MVPCNVSGMHVERQSLHKGGLDLTTSRNAMAAKGVLFGVYE